MPKPITVWAYQDAPEDLREMSPHGGDEDWVAIVPREHMVYDTWPPEDEYDLPEFLRRLGVCAVSVHTLDDQTCIAIGAHA